MMCTGVCFLLLLGAVRTCGSALSAPKRTLLVGRSYPHVPPQTGNPAIASFPALTQSPTYSAFPPAAQSYGLPPFGAMWPGIKTETGLAEAPSVGQTGFLSFSAPYTSAQPGQLHYSYPGQGKRFLNYSALSARPPALCLCLSAKNLQAQHFSYRFGKKCQRNERMRCKGAHSVNTPTPRDRRQSNFCTVLLELLQSLERFACHELLGRTALMWTPLCSPPDSSVAVAPPAGMRERDEGGCRNSSGKAKAKARKSESTLPVDSNLERIFLWDLDETIIIFHSLLTGTFAQKFGKDQTTVLNLGLQMEELIFELADTHLFFNDLEECDQVHIEDVASDDNGQDLSNYNFAADGFSAHSGSSGQGSGGVQGGVEWMRKLAFRYRRLREIYSSFKSNVGGLLNPVKREQLLRLQADIESVTDSWMSTALKSLLLIQSRGRCVNILVTTTQLVPALAKVLLYGLGDVFPIENIYSATKIGKESCFERIVSRFGKKVTYVVIGDGRDEELAAKQHNMPFWRISTHGDLVSLHQALELDFL
uniref:Eyes absent homolog n=1 Tax=Scleropages formosus TaxID=113540 RepID=A0A8C9T9C5_SCLFO